MAAAAEATAASLTSTFSSEWPELETRAVALLQKLIQTDTRNRGDDGTETKAVEILKEVYDQYGIDYEIVEPKPGRGNIIACLKGDGSGGGPLCLSAHLDTVFAPSENWEEVGWKHDPFGGIIDEEDGCLYGRGAIDMKQMAAMSVTLICFIKEKGLTLSRDLIVACIADEERTASTYGIKYLINNRPELIEADIVFTEVGGMSVHMDGQEAFPIMIGEKGSMKLKITASGPGGHSSTYHKDNPVAKIGEIANTLATKRLPLRVVPGGRLTIESLADVIGGIKGMALRRLLSPTFSEYIADHLLSDMQVRALLPVLHNTACPTIIGGGENQNQVPTNAWVLVDARILPGCTMEDALSDIRTLIGVERFQERYDAQGHKLPPELNIEILSQNYSYQQDLDTPGLKEVIDVITGALKTASNGGPVFTNIISGSTDLTYYARHPTRKPLCIGFEPFRLPPGVDLVSLFHGVNERIPVEGYKWGLKVLMDVVERICNVTTTT